MFKIYLVSSVVWVLYTAAIIGYMVAVFTYDLVSTSAVVGIFKIITCLAIGFAYMWMIYLCLVLKRAYEGMEEITRSEVKTPDVDMN